MKPIFILLGILIFAISSPLNAQSAFRKKYFVKDTIFYPAYKNQKFIQEKGDDKNVTASKNAKIKTKISDPNIKKKKLEKLLTEINSLENELKFSDTLFLMVVDSVTNYETNPSKKVIRKDTVFFDTSIFKANATFKEDRVWINPWLYKNSKLIPRDIQMYYLLPNRLELSLHYQQITISPITVPLKVQFGKEKTTKFTTGISLGGLVGYSWGWTKFTHRKNIDNLQRSHEITVGGLFSFQGIEIDLGNEITRETVATSIGIGITYAYDKINFGLTGGLDYAHGFGAEKWTFQGRPWLGIVFGYSLFE